MQQFDVPIVRKTYELHQTLHDFQRTIPKADRYTIWQRCENRSLEILEGFIRTTYLPQNMRPQHLLNISAHVDMLRIFIRLCFDVKAISQKKFIDLQAKVDEIGRMLGGWIKSLKPKAPPQ